LDGSKYIFGAGAEVISTSDEPEVGEMRRAAYHVIGEQLSQDTIECLERLLHEAKAGKIIGIAFAALMKRQHYIAHSCGEVGRQRVLTRGILRELDDKLSKDHQH